MAAPIVKGTAKCIEVDYAIQYLIFHILTRLSHPPVTKRFSTLPRFGSSTLCDTRNIQYIQRKATNCYNLKLISVKMWSVLLL